MGVVYGEYYGGYSGGYSEFRLWLIYSLFPTNPSKFVLFSECKLQYVAEPAETPCVWKRVTAASLVILFLLIIV